MKVLLKAFAVLALAATACAQGDSKPLECEVTEPKRFEVWEVGKVASTAWTCKTPNNMPLRKVDRIYSYHIELGTGDDKNFKYADTLDHAALVRFTRFDWILKSYPPGDKYVVRMLSKTKGFKLPKLQSESDKLDWTYIFPIAIVAKDDDKGVKRAEEQFANQRGDKDEKDDGDKEDAKDETEESAGDDSAETDKNGAGKNGAEGPGADGTAPGADDQGNSATSLLVGNSLLFAASAIAGALVL